MASTSALTLDDLIPSPTSKNVVPLPPRDDHLFYPSLDDYEASGHATPPPDAHPRQILKDRLYIGNLHPSVDEYTLLQVFSKFGKVTKLDYLFHKTGPLKGKPRGYAFLEYADKDEALKALTMAHEKPLRGRKLIVTFAQQAPLDQYPGGPLNYKTRKTMMDVGRPTTLSMLKTGAGQGGGGRHHEGRTQDKIAMMEAKLRQMERTDPKPALPPRPPTVAETETDADVDMDTHGPSSLAPTPVNNKLPAHPHSHLPPNPSHTASSSSSSLPYHPSLPAKPPPVIAALQVPMSTRHSTASMSKLPPKPGSLFQTKPKLPDPQTFAAPLLRSLSASTSTGTGASSTGAGARSHANARTHKLTGVRIKSKPKEKEKVTEKGDEEMPLVE